MDAEDRIAASAGANSAFLAPFVAERPAGPRTTLLLRCSAEQAQRIKAAAKRRSTTISFFVLHVLATSWHIQRTLSDES
jgi:uncharacterized protein (DUF1778 family)